MQFEKAMKVGWLSLKRRMNKNQKPRIVAFVGSPLRITVILDSYIVHDRRTTCDRIGMWAGRGGVDSMGKEIEEEQCRCGCD